MPIYEVPRVNWMQELNRFTTAYEGWLGAQPEIDNMPLLGVSADLVNHDGATAALLIESTDATRTVLQLRAVGSLPET